MSFQFSPKIKWKPIALIMAMGGFVCAQAWAQTGSVQTYTDQAIPPAQTHASYGTPLGAGQMTLEDVLETHPLPAKPALQPPNLSAGNLTSSAPVAASPAQASAESDMLMQGMKSVLQQSGTPPLQAPQLPGAATAASASVSTAPSAAPEAQTASPPAGSAASAFRYQPGQEPKNLANGTPLNVTPAPASAPPSSQANAEENAAPPAPAPAAALSSGACEPHTEKWTKSCAEAGYPANFTGQVAGETRTSCPEGSLQDVWVSNTCASPAPGSEEAAAPLSAPIPAQAAPQPSVTVTGAASSIVDGSCGPANGPAVNTAPVGDLCNSGRPGAVTGNGPWRWDCEGMDGGITVSCASAVLVTAAQAAAAPQATAANTSVNGGLEDGQCGAANGTGTDQMPAANLCAKGLASRVNGDGPWTWACSGRNGGQAVVCSAAKKTDGVCGGASSTGASGMPTTDLCAAGYASAITGEGPWNWTCSGLYGGTAALCAAAPREDAICGTSSLYGHREAPRDNLCSVGQASNVNGGGPWTWTCNGANGGAPVSCSSPISIAGSCGTADGVATPSAPAENLCAHGKPSRVTGNGPWQWNCSGVDGGESQSCAAPLGAASAAAVPETESSASPSQTSMLSSAPAAATNGNGFVACGPAADFAAFSAPAKDLCAKGDAGTVTGSNPWTWACADNSGHSVNCSTLVPSSTFGESAPANSSEMPAPHAAPQVPVSTTEEKPACGAAAGQGTASAPSDFLCATGIASPLQGDGPWSWTCEKGNAKVSCEAPRLQDASCGIANGSMQRGAPVNGLCNAGMPTEVKGSGPWVWTCVGTGGGVSVSCSAAAQTQTKVDGACGAAASAVAISAPSANLCDGGMPSAVYGNGPWTWTCSGLNGGIASLCSAQKTLPQAPPPPGPLVNGLCGDANGVPAVMQPEDGLCSAGTTTKISGNGPWNWNCIGANGGMTVSCTAPLEPPAPITGMCGSATGVPTLTTPTAGLCAAGISSAVSGHGPWTWSCSGTNGGGAVACVAPLAGGGGSGLPSLVTPSAEAPAPQPAATASVTSAHLVTPRLTDTDGLPPTTSAVVPDVTPSSSFPAMPAPSEVPSAPASADSSAAPSAAPDLSDTAVVPPPPVRDTLAPSPALKPPAIDMSGAVIPGNKAVLPDELSVVDFKPNAENMDNSALPILDKLALILKSNEGERITLTSYAGVGPDTSPRDARRLSLTRALAIRDYLTAKGISSARINVRALGANVPSGDPDRVDIKAE